MSTSGPPLLPGWTRGDLRSGRACTVRMPSLVQPSITCALVTTVPSRAMKKPEPLALPRSALGFGAAASGVAALALLPRGADASAGLLSAGGKTAPSWRPASVCRM